MAAPNSNWIYDKDTVAEKDRIALERAKKVEAKDIKKGYRWVRINNITKILVECDKDGLPTKRGQEHIDRYKSL